MTVYDWAIMVVGAAFVVVGWRRGLLREAIDLGLLLFGSLVVFRLSPIIGTIVSGMANIPYEVGRVFAGGLVFVGLVVGAIIVGRIVATAMRVVPGATTLNKLGGAAVGLGFAVVVIVLGTTLLVASPLPADVRSPFSEAVEASPIGRSLIDASGPARPIVAVVTGDELYGAVIAVREAVGERLMAGTVPVPFPSVNSVDLSPSQTLAQQVFDDVNRERISAGIDPLAWSPDLAIVSVSRASNVYQSGVLALDAELTAALAAAGVPGTIHTDLVVMAASADGLVEAITTASAYDATITDPAFRKAGVGVVDGPYGLIAVQVLSG